MTRPPLSDETLMAYSDGELDAEAMADVEAAMTADPSVAERVAMFDVSRQVLKDGLGAPEPVSPELLASVRAIAAGHEAKAESEKTESESKVVALPARTRVPRPAPIWQLPMAASIALLIGLAAGPFMPWTGTAPDVEIALTGLDTPGLTAALATVESGDRLILDDGSALAAIASFQDGAGTFCREFELDGTSGETLVSVACHQGDTWSLRFAVAAGQTSDGFAPASSLEALDGYLTAIEAGEPLSTEAEQAALQALSSDI